MNHEIIQKASAVINSKADYIGGGMEGYAVLSLLDENGYPTSSAITISKTDGINWLSFIVATHGTKAKRVANSNKASVCLASSEYNITLVGTAEIITDADIKRDHWQNVFVQGHHADYDSPDFSVLRFKTETYNLYFAADDTEAKGSL